MVLPRLKYDLTSQVQPRVLSTLSQCAEKIEPPQKLIHHRSFRLWLLVWGNKGAIGGVCCKWGLQPSPGLWIWTFGGSVALLGKTPAAEEWIEMA